MKTRELLKNEKGVIWKQTTLENVLVCNYGVFYNKNTNTYSRAYKKKPTTGGYAVKIEKQEKNAARLMYEAFNGPIGKDMVVVSRLRTSDLNIMHLDLVSRKELGKRTGGNSRNIMIEVYSIKGDYIGTYRSVRKAAKDLFISPQCLHDYLKGKIKKPNYIIKKVE